MKDLRIGRRAAHPRRGLVEFGKTLAVVGACVGVLYSPGCMMQVDGAPSGSGDDAADMERYAWLHTPRGSYRTAYEVVDGLAIAEGDIILGTEAEVAAREDDERLVEKGAYISSRATLWPSATVRYSHASILFNLPAGQAQEVLDAMKIWTDNTGIKFEDAPGRTPTGDYVAFAVGSDCASAVGRQGGLQFITLTPSCGLSTIVHELGHAIGLFHEQARSDRDDYVEVFDENVMLPQPNINFQTWSERDQPGVDLAAWPACNLPAYNYDSMMHYGTHSRSKNDWPTLLRRAESTMSGPKSMLYALDPAPNAPYSAVWEPILGTGISHDQLGYGLFDGDGKADLFRSSGSAWYRSSGAKGGWSKLASSGAVYRKQRSSNRVLFGDFDGNGRTDVVADWSNVWHVSWNGNSSWADLADARLNGSLRRARDLGTGDFDGDGKTDILAEHGGNWYVRYGGVGAWVLYADIAASLPRPWEVGYGDFNGDHVTDIFRVNGQDWEIFVRNPLVPAWSTWERYHADSDAPAWHASLGEGDWTHSIALGDFNGDGLTDVLRTKSDRLLYEYTQVDAWGRPSVSIGQAVAEAITPLHFDNFNLHFVHTCKTVESGAFAGQKRCHAGSDIDGDGITDLLSTQRAPVEPVDPKPTLSAGDIYAVCDLFRPWLGGTCLASCPTSVP